MAFAFKPCGWLAAVVALGLGVMASHGCGGGSDSTGGSGGTGGAGESGGSTGSGGALIGSGGAQAGSGGVTQSGGTKGSGGIAGSGGVSSGGVSGSGGVGGSGGVSGGGGVRGSGGLTGGATPSGGTSSGGTTASGGATGAGGAGGSAGASGIVAAGVRWYGRVDLVTDPQHPRFAWSGTGFVARFNGTGLSATLNTGASATLFKPVVDGAPQAVFTAAAGQSTYSLASGLTAGVHTVELYRQTEGAQGNAQLMGLTVAGGGALMSPPGPSAE